MRRRRPGGGAHAEVDNILPPRPRRSLHRVHLGENIRRQAADAVEIVGHAAACRDLRGRGEVRDVQMAAGLVDCELALQMAAGPGEIAAWEQDWKRVV